MSSKPLVLVVGASGRTGQSVVPALLESGKFRVAALTRPSSLSKPQVNDLRSKGVEIRAADIDSDNIEKLTQVLAGVDVLISVVTAEAILAQKLLIAAAKAAGVKRVIPCDFGTPGKRGVRDLNDKKLTIREYIKELGVGYTFIDIGWWMQLVVPAGSNSPTMLGPWGDEIYGPGDKKMLLTDLEHIGQYVAMIIADERTLNQYVIVWEEEMTLPEAKAISEEQSGEAEAIRARRTSVSHEELLQRAAQGKEEYARSQSDAAHALWAYSQYQISMHILGENSLESAKSLGALDVRELYPDIVPTKMADFARKFYKK